MGVSQAMAVCPEAVRQAFFRINEPERAQELRLRLGQTAAVTTDRGEIALTGVRVNGELLSAVLANATGQAVYAAQDMLRAGFLTLPGGHRLGICGRGIYKDGGLWTVREISSLNLRFARAVTGCANQAADHLWQHPASTLIVGPPCAGKTTLLRDLIRQMSDRFGWRVCVADERLELAACLDGMPQFDLGRRTDVLSGVRKAEAIEMLLRTMNPQWIAVDEITAVEDAQTLLRGSYCGVRFLATAHAYSPSELRQRPLYRQLTESGLFENLVTIRSDRTVHTERWRQID